jgi:probable metal-binding protein
MQAPGGACGAGGALLRERRFRGYPVGMDALRAPTEPVLGHELISLLSQIGGRATVEALRRAAEGAFGPDAVYGNCHGERFTFDEVLAFLSTRGKLSLAGDEVALGTVPACDGH